MFKHILIPTDGSELALKAVSAGIAFAKETGARVTGYCAFEDANLHYVASHLTDALIAELEYGVQELSEKHVAQIGKAASAAGVEFEGLVTRAARPYEGIIAAAKTRMCDIIFMSSHGHRGLSALMMGSVTHKVLTHSSIPVLVFR